MTERHWNSLEEEFTYYACAYKWSKILLNILTKEEKAQKSMILDQNSINSIVHSTINHIPDEVKKFIFKKIFESAFYFFDESFEIQLNKLIFDFSKISDYIERKNPDSIKLRFIRMTREIVVCTLDLTDDDPGENSLRDKFLGLLALSITGDTKSNEYFNLLSQLSSIDSLVLDILFSKKNNFSQDSLFYIELYDALIQKGVPIEFSFEDLEESIDRLTRFGLCETTFSRLENNDFAAISKDEKDFIGLKPHGYTFMKTIVSTFKKQ